MQRCVTVADAATHTQVPPHLLAVCQGPQTPFCTPLLQQNILGATDVRLELESGLIADCTFKRPLSQPDRVTDLQVRSCCCSSSCCCCRHSSRPLFSSSCCYV
jgi:hypothetical protein